jgi:hypothetical protein
LRSGRPSFSRKNALPLTVAGGRRQPRLFANCRVSFHTLPILL